MKKPLLVLIRLYQKLISPLIGKRCRFYPSCSSYMAQAIKIHGTAKGLFLGTKRLLKCGPWHEGGVDPVPKRDQGQISDYTKDN